MPGKTGSIKRDEYEATLLVTKSQTATGSSYQGSNARQPGERKSNFSGTWSFAGVDTGTWGPGGKLSGRSIWFQTWSPASLTSIAHRGRKLEISFKVRVHGRVSKDFYYKNIYFIDGRPHTTTQAHYSKDRSTNKIEIYKTSKFRSIVRWDGDKLVIVVEGEESKWELSESGRELIVGEGKNKTVYDRIS